jgi:nucleoside-diphosphate-sugar epimerase
LKPATFFCFGLGYSAMRLATALQSDGWAVAGTCRSAEQAAKLRDQGIDTHVFDGSAAGDGIAAALDAAAYVLSSVPPGKAGDPVLKYFGPALAARRDLKWLGYLSTTGVYGDTGGAWVDETAPVQADVPRSRDRATAERGWLALHAEHGLPVHLFRLAGIYGPGRSPLERIRGGNARRIDKPGHRFSRIHVDDIAQVLIASMARPNPGAIYNVCDDEPEEPRVVTELGCRLLGIEPPPVVSFDEAAKAMTPMGLSFWQDNRRVRNDRIKTELRVELRYPTYREGLAALVADNQA